ncbi:MAG: hypothetical protein WB791_09885 [Waddliaceae bacterium]
MKEIKAELQGTNEKTHSSFVMQVINPMLREVTQFENDQASIERMEEWTKKGRHWVRLYSKNPDGAAITKAVADHTVEQSLMRIDRDLSYIENYAQDSLNKMGLSPKALMKLKDKVEKKLAPYLTCLRSLKTPPQEKTLSQLEKWKKRVDEQREEQYNGAIHMIDEIL